MKNYITLERRYGFDPYPKRDLVIVRGKGARVWDAEGREYIDCVAGHGVANIGHGNEKVVEAISEQARKLITCPGIFYNDKRALLLEKLISIAPRNLSRAFLCNSGAEAVEGAIKFARFTTGRKEFIAAMKGFHGRTMGALSATFNHRYRKDFEPLVPGFHFIPFNSLEGLREKVNERIAGIILEPVQGEGGVNIGRKEFFKEARRLCDKEGILLIIDEVQTGFGRTGRMFAIEHFGIEPDIMCLAKAIGGGMPMGAVLCSHKVEIPKGRHGSTFGGNPLSCSSAIATIDFIVENDLPKKAEEKGDYFITKLRSYRLPKVREIRNLGLMIGIELEEKVKPYLIRLMEEGVLALPAGPRVIRLLPPLTITYEELDLVVEKLVSVLG